MGSRVGARVRPPQPPQPPPQPTHHPQVIPSADLLSAARLAVDAWAPVSNHPGLAGLRAAFVGADAVEGGTGAGGGSALYFAYDYHPGAVTLAQVRAPRM